MEEWYRVLVESGNRIRAAPPARRFVRRSSYGRGPSCKFGSQSAGTDRVHSIMPDDVVQTFFSHLLSKSELATLQTEHDFQPNESLLRGEAFVILG